MARSYFAAVQSKPVTELPFAYPELSESPLVLCVDDDPAILELLEDILTACGLRVICTTDCVTAMRFTACEPVDLVVLDYHMPQMDGLTLARRLRRFKSQVPMIMYSGTVLPLDAFEVVSRVVRKGEGALPLADAVLETLRGSGHDS